MTTFTSSLTDLIPSKTNRSAVTKPVFYRLVNLVGPAQRSYTNGTVNDLVDECTALLAHVGCSVENCHSAMAVQPKHLYYHLLTECLDHVDAGGNTIDNHGEACPNCVGGIMDNRQRGAWMMAVAEAREPKAPDAEAEAELEVSSMTEGG